jgi:hypothetical protein
VSEPWQKFLIPFSPSTYQVPTYAEQGTGAVTRAGARAEGRPSAAAGKAGEEAGEVSPIYWR